MVKVGNGKKEVNHKNQEKRKVMVRKEGNGEKELNHKNHLSELKETNKERAEDRQATLCTRGAGQAALLQAHRGSAAVW